MLLESWSGPGLPSKDGALSTSGRRLRHFHSAITFRSAALICSQTTVTGRPVEIVLWALALALPPDTNSSSISIGNLCAVKAAVVRPSGLRVNSRSARRCGRQSAG
jgi:hypothetical protein